MDKTNPPETFGVFKPVGYTVITFRSDADRQRAVNALIGEGFVEPDFVRYSAKEMITQVDAELLAASPLAAFGYELDLIKANKVWAAEGCNFLVVYAPDKTRADRVATVVRASKAVAAQHYGTFMIEELLEPSLQSAAAS